MSGSVHTFKSLHAAPVLAGWAQLPSTQISLEHWLLSAVQAVSGEFGIETRLHAPVDGAH
jgi:hypothetical protein